MKCFAHNGTWVYDPTPLLWEPQGLAHCDLMWCHCSTPCAQRSTLSPPCGGSGGLIPGSRLPTPEAVAGTRATLECFARNGTWVYDPTPRVLPWEPQGLAHCDLMWLRAGNSSIAGRVANLAQDPEDWNVRDALKYRCAPLARLGTGACTPGTHCLRYSLPVAAATGAHTVSGLS